MNNLILGGRSGWVYYETIGGGQGGRPGRAGMNGVHTAMTNTLDTPTEALERAHPVRVLRYRLRPGSGGRGPVAGRRRDRAGHSGPRAGHAVAHQRAPGERAVGSARRPPGRGRRELAVAGRRRIAPPGASGDKVTVELAAGDAVCVCTPGGGGYGEPQRGEPTSNLV